MEIVISDSSEDSAEILEIKPPQIGQGVVQTSRARSSKRYRNNSHSSERSDTSVHYHHHRRHDEYYDRNRHRHHRHKRRYKSSGQDLRDLLLDKRGEKYKSDRHMVITHEESERETDKLRVRIERQVLVSNDEIKNKYSKKSDHRTRYSDFEKEAKHRRRNGSRKRSSGNKHSQQRKKHRKERNNSETESERSDPESSSSENSVNDVLPKPESSNSTPNREIQDPDEVVQSRSPENCEEDSDDSSSTKTAESDSENHDSEHENDNDFHNSFEKKSSGEESVVVEGFGEEEDVERITSLDSPQYLVDDDEEDYNSLPPYLPAIQGCRSVEEFQCLNKIEEGSFGVVYRARDKRTQDVVALKKLKMAKEKEGFPITALREINTLLKAQHPNIVTVREIVVGSNMDQIFIVMDFVEQDLNALMRSMKKKNQICNLTPATAAA